MKPGFASLIHRSPEAVARPIYVNTLMLQRILTEPAWLERMTPEDHRALTPAIHAQINPYGRLCSRARSLRAHEKP
jgi:hypothetical protein